MEREAMERDIDVNNYPYIKYTVRNYMITTKNSVTICPVNFPVYKYAKCTI